MHRVCPPPPFDHSTLQNIASAPKTTRTPLRASVRTPALSPLPPLPLPSPVAVGAASTVCVVTAPVEQERSKPGHEVMVYTVV